MKYIKSFKTINEMRQSELDELFHKLSNNNLSGEDKNKLDSWDGIIDNNPLDDVEIDDKGDLRINGERANPYNIDSELYDGDNDISGNRKLTVELQKEINYFIEEMEYENGRKDQLHIETLEDRIISEFGISIEDSKIVIDEYFQSKRI